MSRCRTPKNSFDRSASDQVMISIRKIVQAIDMNSKKLVKRVGLTGPQLVILHEIANCDKVTAGELARAVSLSQSTVTGILERLEKRQLITRQRSDDDKRRVLVRITNTGTRILESAPPIMQETFVERFSSIEEWEQSMILCAIQRLVSLMDAKTIEAAPFLATTGSINPIAKKKKMSASG